MGKVIGCALFACALGGTIVFAVGYGTPNWTSWGNITQGLWEICYDSSCFKIQDMIQDVPRKGSFIIY